MNIVIVDYLCPKNHVYLYGKIIKCLSNIGKIKVVTELGYYSDEIKTLKSVEYVELKFMREKNSMISRKLRSLNMMLKTRKAINSNKSGINIALTFDTVSFALGRLFLTSSNLFILHHKNIDELQNKAKRLIFKSYMNKVNHIVFEKSFKDYLVNIIGVNEKNVYVMPHLIPHVKNIKNEIIYDCVGLSNSNDEKFIEKIIQAEKENNFIKNKNLKIILRAKEIQYDNGYLKVISGFLPKNEYDDYIYQSKCVFVPLPQSFRYRISGAIYDALSNYKIVIANNVQVVKEYQKLYPKICTGISSVDEFFNHVVSVNQQQVESIEFDKFIFDHDDKKFTNAFLELVQKYNKGGR